MKPNRLLTAALGACALTAAFTGPAQAVERGTCLPAAQMIQTLRAEGQRSVIEADMMTGNPRTLPLIMYTTNADGSRGYEVGGDRPRDPGNPAQAAQRQPATLCISSVLTDVRLNGDAAIPSSFRLASSIRSPQLEEAARAAGVRNYGDHNTLLDTGARMQNFPALQARVVINGQPGRRLTVSFSNSDREGAVFKSWDTGLAENTAMVQNATFTRYAVERMASRQGTTTLASLDVRR